MEHRKIAVMLLVILLLMVGCTSTKIEYVNAPLPEFSPSIPERPELAEVTSEMPVDAVLNTIKLMTYAQELEAYGEAWRTFYEELVEK